MTDLLIVMNPRRIEECLRSINELDIDKLWMRNMSEFEIEERWPEILVEAEGYENLYMVGDDSITRQRSLDAVRELLAEGHPVVTAYANLDSKDWRLNIDRARVKENMGIPEHDFYSLGEAMTWPEKAIPTTLCGFCPTGMSYGLWERFPFQANFGSDLNLSIRLQAAGIPIVAARDAFCWHVKENWNKVDEEPRKRLLVNVEPSAIVLEAA